MNRTIVSQGFLFALTALLAAACTQPPKEAPKATATLSVSDSKGLNGSEEYDILVEKEEE